LKRKRKRKFSRPILKKKRGETFLNQIGGTGIPPGGKREKIKALLEVKRGSSAPRKDKGIPHRRTEALRRKKKRHKKKKRIPEIKAQGGEAASIFIGPMAYSRYRRAPCQCIDAKKKKATRLQGGEKKKPEKRPKDCGKSETGVSRPHNPGRWDNVGGAPVD